VQDEFEFAASDGAEIHCYRWHDGTPPRALIQIAHGMGEHAARYRDVAERLVGEGYLVLADDHRGHGATAGPDRLGAFGPLGSDRVIDDLHELNRHLRQRFPGVPLVMLGHSMGAMLLQQYLYRYGTTLDAAVISGSPGLGNPLELWLMHSIARFERWRRGATAQSPLLERLVFGAANDPFEGETGFEWLSRDVVEVQRYVDDAYCGFVLDTGSLCSLFAGARAARRMRNVRQIPNRLPIYVFSGGDDPVHGSAAGLERLEKRYRRAGVADLTVRLYPGGRHEMFNETNRAEVVTDLLDWLRLHVGR
jgi:alpha-beta hydrolase superfamily lysophospholipase